jgi:hypothetical protein
MDTSTATARDHAAQMLSVKRLRAMTGEQRMKLAFAMCRTAWRIAEDAVRNQNPGITDQEVEAKLRERLQLYHQLNNHPVPVPRRHIR